ncbi:hypothetical protein Q7P37_011341 [Cladosporium fusiforme]
MAPLTRRNSALSKKIATLQLELAPLVPLPSGPPHPAFPKTLLAFHLLTEDELDSIAHHYHQSTPGPWTQHYPALMNWDKDFLARPAQTSSGPSNSTRSHAPPVTSPASAADVDAALSASTTISEQEFLETLMHTVKDLQSATAPTTLRSSPESDVAAAQQPSATAKNPYAGLSDKDRIRIKRRKVVKFIGLVGMETPVEEIAGRIQASLDRAVERSREELRRNEEVMLRRRKMA